MGCRREKHQTRRKNPFAKGPNPGKSYEQDREQTARGAGVGARSLETRTSRGGPGGDERGEEEGSGEEKDGNSEGTGGDDAAREEGAGEWGERREGGEGPDEERGEVGKKTGPDFPVDRIFCRRRAKEKSRGKIRGRRGAGGRELQEQGKQRARLRARG